MITGGILGFIMFLLFLESKGMGNVIIRGGKFVPWNVIHYIKNPFIRRFLWYPRMWCGNWLIMVGCGCFVEEIIKTMKK